MRTAGDGEPVSTARREHPTGHHDRPVDSGHLDGRRKAAILLVLLGSELASDIFKHLDEEEIEQLSLEIAQLDAIAPEDQIRALAEFQELMLERDPALGGMDYARAVLERSLGADKADAVVDRVARILRPRPFGFMRRSDPAQLLSFLRDEHPQTIALILAYMDPGDAAGLLASLPYAMQGDVARRIATLDPAAPEVVHEVERVLQDKLARSSRPAGASERGAAEGIEAIVQIFHLMDRTTEQSVIDALEQEDPDLAQEVRQRLFGFEDLLLLDDQALQAVLREVSRQQLAAALKAVDAEILERVVRNMSKRGAALLRDTMEHLGPIRLGEVEEAQRGVAGVIRSLQQRGEIALNHR